MRTPVTEEEPAVRPAHAAALCGAFGVGLGLVVLAASAVGFTWATRMVPGQTAMVPLTAAMFVLLGIALMAQARGAPTHPRVRLLACAVVALIAGLVLSEDIGGWDLGVDDALGTPPGDTTHPGRPSPATASVFLLLGAAVAAPHRGGRTARLANGLAWIAALGTLATGLGFLLGIEFLRGTGSVKGIAPQTAAGLAVMAAGVFALRPDIAPGSWVTGHGGGEVAARHLLPIALALPIVGAILVDGGSTWGWWGPEVGLLLFALASTIGLIVMIGVIVRRVREDEAVQRRLVAEVQAAEARITRTVQQLAEAVSIIDVDGTHMMVNAASQAILDDLAQRHEQRPLDAVGWGGVREDGSPVPDDELPAEITRRTGVECTDELLGFPGAAGDVRWLRISTRRLTDGPPPHQVIVSFHDVTAQREQTRQIALLERRLRLSMRNAPIGMAIVDLRERRSIEVNDALCEIFGRSSADILTLQMHSQAHPDDAERIRACMEPVARGERESGRLKARYFHANGDILWLDVSVSVVRDDDGHPELLISQVQDVTASEHAALALREAEERFRLAFDHAPIGIALVATDGAFLRVNRALCDMTGYAEGELLAKAFDDITHPDDVAADRELVAQVLGGKLRSYEVEKRVRRCDGATMWILLSVSVVRGPDDEPQYLISQIQDITARKTHERELRYLADHDALTGLANRRQLGAELTRRIAEQRRYGHEFSLILIDLDNFKYINDSLGHSTGDRMLRAVAETLQSRLRETDLIARLGGDEFAVVLPQTGRDAAETVTRDLVQSVRALRVHHGGQVLHVSASAGLACSEEYPDSDEDGMLVLADLAMYEAKELGRDRYAVHAPADDMRGRESARMNWSHRIRKALEDDRFILHYQPIIDLTDPAARRWEALIRLDDADDGELVPPGTFLYIAERYGLLTAIDRWVCRQVITALTSDELPERARVALNVSAHSLGDERLLDLGERLIGTTGLDPGRLCFEVTESVAFSKLEDARRFGRRLQRMGCEFAIDDFGTGFSSFTHIKHLPYGLIKIDGEFVRGVSESSQDRAVVEAIVHLARAMGKRTIAEYVHDEATLQTVRALGVDMVQGFHLGRPVPADDLMAAGPSTGPS